MANEKIKQEMIDYLNRKLTGDIYNSEEKIEELYNAYRLGHELLSPDREVLEWDRSTDTWSIGSSK